MRRVTGRYRGPVHISVLFDEVVERVIRQSPTGLTEADDARDDHPGNEKPAGTPLTSRPENASASPTTQEATAHGNLTL